MISLRLSFFDEKPDRLIELSKKSTNNIFDFCFIQFILDTQNKGAKVKKMLIGLFINRKLKFTI